MRPKTFYVIGGQCPRSKQDAQTIFNYYVTNGLTPVKKIKNADIICVYTCGGFNDTENSSLRTIQGMMQQKSPHAIVVATGCLTKINPSSMDRFHHLRVIPYDDLEQLDTIIQAKTSFQKTPNAGVIHGISPLYGDQLLRSMLELRSDQDFIKNIPSYLKNQRKIYVKRIKERITQDIYHIRIARGCLGSCSYCTIKLAHGRLHSRPLTEIQQDLEEGIQQGYTVFKLLGQDIGCYGLDIDRTIVELLQIFFKLPAKNKIILTDFYPEWLVKYYDQLEPLFVAHHERILSLRTPIESGSNHILRLMRRRYDIEDVKKHLSLLQQKIPTLKIFTHIIVGFPGETEEDFQQTVDLLKHIHFSSVGLFGYSDRPMADSFTMKDKIPADVIKERMERIKKQIPLTD